MGSSRRTISTLAAGGAASAALLAKASGIAARRASVVREIELVVADLEGVAFVDHFTLHALPVILDAVRRAHIDDVILSARELDHRVLARHVRVFDGEVARLLAATDDEAVFG